MNATKTSQGIRLKNANEVDILRKAGKILSSIVVQLQSSLTSGMSTKDIDLKAEELIRQNKVISAFKGYRGFPGVTCISVNEGVVHGIPGKRTIKDGDIVSVDIGIIYEGYYSDTAVTVPVGKISTETQRLLDVILTKANLPLDFALNMEADAGLLLKRLTGRRVCRKCGALFHMLNKPPLKAGVCDLCGGELY